MKFTYLELNGYIGIYNGMGLYKIAIDFTKCKHRITVIKGTNGSGKSTIWNALSMFPDGTENFIPDMSASKIACASRNGILYKAQFFHDLKPNGTRGNTRAFLSKMDENGNYVELNPNGNVGTYKELIFTELNLDPNFFALSKLSMDDRGIGYKTPSERKRFVTSIIDSLDYYNQLYKGISKQINALKAVMASITTSLQNLGDRGHLENLRISVDRDLDHLRRERDEANVKILQLDASIQLIDPTGTIREIHNQAKRKLKSEMNEFNKLMASYDYPNMIYHYESDSAALGEKLKDLYNWQRYFEDEKTKYTAASQSLITRAADIKNRIQSLTESTNNADLDEIKTLKDAIGDVTSEAADLAIEISNIGIDPSAFTKDEYILALETVHEIVEEVNQLRFMFPMDILTKCKEEYAATGYTTIQVIPYDEEKKLVDSFPERSAEFSLQIAKAEADLALMQKLDNRPDACQIDSCYFIADAVEASKRNPEATLNRLISEYETFKMRVKQAQDKIAYCEQYNNCINMMRVIIRSIDKNGSILSRLPNGGIFTSKAQFFEKLVGGESFEFIDKIYQYIHLANHFDMYRALQSQAHEYYLKLDALETKMKSYEKFQKMIDEMQADLNNIHTQLDMHSFTIRRIDDSLARVKSQIDYINNVQIPACDNIHAHIVAIREAEKAINDIKTQMDDIERYMNDRTQFTSTVKVMDMQTQYKEKERDSVMYKLQQIEDYNKSLEEYKKDYEIYDKIRYYSNPNTGIQLVFMQLYMGRILEVANSLLQFLFNGTYQLLPFIINGDEFRIPCAGNGYVNEDISSMSSSQLTMISMVLSFALLTVASTDYNIIKFDEIDDPLDEPNRMGFALMIDTIMDQMGTEQCIMISHSSEMVVSDADIILLRSDGLLSIDPSQNVIWDYSQQ